MLSTRALAIANGFAAFGRSLLSVASSAIPAVIGGVKAMTLALMANPIGLAIAAIAAGAALIIYYWEPIKTFFGKLWHGIKAGAQSVWDAVAKVVEPIKKVKDMVGSAWNWLFGGKDDKAKPANGNRKVGSAVKTFAGRDVDAMNIQARKAVNRQTTNSSTVNTSITVNAAPGMDERKVAAEVQKALRESERRAKTRKRAANYD